MLGKLLPMTSPKTVGENSEAQTLARMLRHGEVVLLPFGDNQRYDMALDRTDGFVRLQVKTGRLRGGAVRFQTASSGSTTGQNSKVGYVGSIEAFAVYCPENDKVYLVPIQDTPGAEMSLRIEFSKNRQNIGVHIASDYEYPHGPVAQQVRARS
jgi:hypothetical protein